MIKGKITIDEPSTDSWAAWFASRPACVQALILQYPVETHVFLDDRRAYIIGWTENDKLILSWTDPEEDYDEARADPLYVCVRHFKAQGSCPCGANIIRASRSDSQCKAH
jgi:hypothetical protein